VAHAEDYVHHFATCVLEGRKPLVPLEQSLHLQYIIEALYASAASGKEVPL
jgi:predicted dehydrogenase